MAIQGDKRMAGIGGEVHIFHLDPHGLQPALDLHNQRHHGPEINSFVRAFTILTMSIVQMCLQLRIRPILFLQFPSNGAQHQRVAFWAHSTLKREG